MDAVHQVIGGDVSWYLSDFLPIALLSLSHLNECTCVAQPHAAMMAVPTHAPVMTADHTITLRVS